MEVCRASVVPDQDLEGRLVVAAVDPGRGPRVVGRSGLPATLAALGLSAPAAALAGATLCGGRAGPRVVGCRGLTATAATRVTAAATAGVAATAAGPGRLG